MPSDHVEYRKTAGENEKSTSPGGMIERLIFRYRPVVAGCFLLTTLVMGYFASHLQISAGFDKMLPVGHPYIQTFLKMRESFGGGDRIAIALIKRDGDIFSEDFFEKLRKVHEQLFLLPEIYRPSVRSIFSPDVRYIDIIEGGFAGGPIVPPDFKPSPEMFAQVKQNIVKGEQEGNLVANRFVGALITADLQTKGSDGKPVDYRLIAKKLEDVRAKYQSKDIGVSIIGFAKSTGDIAEGARSVFAFFFVTLTIIALVLTWYTRSMRVACAPLASAMVAVILQLGVMSIAGLVLDPLNMLLPFIIVALAVSHGIQMISRWTEGYLALAEQDEAALGSELRITEGDALSSARRAFRLLARPGSIAVLTDVFGFGVLLSINIAIIRELAVSAVIGLVIMMLTNLILLPVLLSYVRIRDVEKFRDRYIGKRGSRMQPWWLISIAASPRVAPVVVLIGLAISIYGFSFAKRVDIGDVTAGVSELYPGSRYNRDAEAIMRNFSVGADELVVFAHTKSSGCVDYRVMQELDNFVSYVKRDPNVVSIRSLSETAKRTWVGYNEGSPKWYVVPRNTESLTLATNVELGTRLLNVDCSVMPIYIYMRNHQAGTIGRVFKEINTYKARQKGELIVFELAGGNVGVIGATNEVVRSTEFPILIYIYGSIIGLLLILFRSIKATIAIISPLVIISMLAYAVMYRLGIGLKINTLPVASLGAGVGVDYGIYLYSHLVTHLRNGVSLREAYYRALTVTGRGVVVTGLTLAAGVGTWIYSDLKFQSDIGVMLGFKFFLSMVSAILVLPAVCCLLRVSGSDVRANAH